MDEYDSGEQASYGWVFWLIIGFVAMAAILS